MSGAAACVDVASFVTCDHGEAVLIARPIYTGFPGDVHLHSRNQLVPVSLKGVDPMGTETIERYEKVLKEQAAKGVKVGAMILCNPHNPLGQCYVSLMC